MSRKIKIRRISTWNIVLTVVIALLVAGISARGEQEFQSLREATDRYVACEKATAQLRKGSDYLTEQVRLYTMTGKSRYMSRYFTEVNTVQSRDLAVKELKKYFSGSDSLERLEDALVYSDELMSRECYAMRLVAEAQHYSDSDWPERVKVVQLSAKDKRLNDQEKMDKAQDLVSNESYQNEKAKINRRISNCENSLLSQTKNDQARAETIFEDVFKKMKISLILFGLVILGFSIIVRRLIVRPLIFYNESIKKGTIFPVVGAAELQSLAETYNQVYLENEETQRLIRHQAEHDALTDSLNRGSFERLLDIYERGEDGFALLLIDVDNFKSVNDTYGHATGDKILKEVSELLQSSFRSIDYVCRIGGDEFAVIMVEMNSRLRYTIEEKMDSVRERLAEEKDGLPKVSLSVGIAFSDRENPEKSIFEDADQALYKVKENGRDGYRFFGDK